MISAKTIADPSSSLGISTREHQLIAEPLGGGRTIQFGPKGSTSVLSGGDDRFRRGGRRLWENDRQVTTATRLAWLYAKQSSPTAQTIKAKGQTKAMPARPAFNQAEFAMAA